MIKEINEMKVRTAENTNSDIYMNINDLIIDLMMEAEKSDNQAERAFIKKLIAKLVSKRNEAHKKATSN